METEVVANFYNAKEALPFRVTLAEMGHPQPQTTSDSISSVGLVYLVNLNNQTPEKPVQHY